MDGGAAPSSTQRRHVDDHDRDDADRGVSRWSRSRQVQQQLASAAAAAASRRAAAPRPKPQSEFQQEELLVEVRTCCCCAMRLCVCVCVGARACRVVGSSARVCAACLEVVVVVVVPGGAALHSVALALVCAPRVEVVVVVVVPRRAPPPSHSRSCALRVEVVVVIVVVVPRRAPPPLRRVRSAISTRKTARRRDEEVLAGVVSSSPSPENKRGDGCDRAARRARGSVTSAMAKPTTHLPSAALPFIYHLFANAQDDDEVNGEEEEPVWM